MTVGEILGWVTTVLEATGLMPFVQAMIVVSVVTAFVRKMFGSRE